MSNGRIKRVLFCVLFAVNSTALAESATSQASAVILEPLNITNTAPLNFGDLISSDTAGTLTINSNGERISNGGTTLGPTSGNSAQFQITGQADRHYSINLPSEPVIIQSGTNTIQLNSFTTDATGVLNNDGIENINIGATINVGADAAPGNYSGSFQVEIIY